MSSSQPIEKQKIINLIQNYIPSFYLELIPLSEREIIIDVLAYGLSLVSTDISNIDTLYSIDDIQTSFLPYLAYLIGYIYDFRFTTNAFLSNETILRNQLRQAVAWMKLKGTALGIKQFLLSLGVDSYVRELWYNANYDDVIPAEAADIQVTDEIFRDNINNNSIQFVYNNGVIDSSEINSILHEFITGSFVHTNIVNGSIVVKIEQTNGVDWMLETELIQDPNNNFVYGSEQNIEVNLGKAEVVSSIKQPQDVTLTSNKLSFKVEGGAEQIVTLLTNTNRYYATIANEINNQTTGITAYVDNDFLVISSDANDPNARIEIVDIVNNAYSVLGLEVGVYNALTRTYFDPATEFLVIELKQPENFSEYPIRVIVDYQYTRYEQPASITSFDYKTGAKSNWFDIDMWANNDNFILTADTVVEMITTVKEEIKPFHALLRQVNFSSLISDILPPTIDEFTGDIDALFIDRIAQCCLLRDNCIKFTHDGAVPSRPQSSLTRSDGCLPKGTLVTHNGFITQRDNYTIYLRNLYTYDRWPYNNNGDTERNYVFRDGLQYRGRVYHRDYCNYPKIVGRLYENFVIDNTNNRLLISLTGFGTYDITLTNGTWTANQIADMINSVTLSNFMITYLVHQLVASEDIIVDVYLSETPRELSEITEVTVDSAGTVELQLASNDDGLVVLATTNVYAKTFTSTLQATVTPAEHGFGTGTDLHVFVMDDSTPRKKIKTQNINITGGTVTVDFDTLQAGKILVRENSNTTNTFTSQTTLSLDATDHGLSSEDMIVQVYDTNDDMIIPKEVFVQPNGEVEIQFETVESGYWVISQADWSTAFNTAPGQGLVAMGLGGFVRLIGKVEFDPVTKAVGYLTLIDVTDDAYDTLGFVERVAQNVVCDKIYNNPPTELETSSITNDKVFTYVYDEFDAKIIPNELQVSNVGVINLNFTTTQKGSLLLAGNFSYDTTFSVTSPFIVSIPSATHALGATDQLAVQVMDDSTPRKIILPKDVEIAANGDVTVYFETDQDGQIIIRNAADKYAKPFTGLDTIIIPKSEHVVQGDISVYVYDNDSPRKQIIPNSISLSVSNDVIVELDTAQDGQVIIHGDWEFNFAFDTVTGNVQIIPGVTGQIYLGYDRTEVDELLLLVT